MPAGSSITALLGPTNTGKTHRAVERMLAYDSGMIGLPLRLLAREVYDRLTARVGESRVALVTGEEKRVPRRPAYWVCTVEAMPTNLDVEFLAVDEIQLSAHDQRGHVFTDRLLAARGTRETWFLGADTMRPLVEQLVPTARVLQHPRLSRLSFAGRCKLSRLPPRSAVVAFSTDEVYRIAERLRALRGGAAVVLGALSPRTRNAQVALFQAGEVDILVATDAIGMGLNLDIHHVAFASLRKFDGKVVRDLEPAELAQIAGRAGRHIHDGTFGAAAPLDLPAGVAASIEGHRFPAVRRIRWRNTDLDSSSIPALLGSLRARPRARTLRMVEDAEDTAALLKLAENPAIRARAAGAEAVSLLWDVCCIPDFRKLLFESHVALLGEIYQELTGPRGVLASDWMAARVADIDDISGDVDTLITKIASIRTFTYISNHTRWVRDASEWQERTRAVEDRLSDALHDRLVQRFVERTAGRGAAAATPARGRRAASPEPANRHGSAHPFARLSALRASLAEGPAPAAPGRDAWVESLIASSHDRFSIDASARIAHDGRPLAQLTRGATLLLPEVRLAALHDLGAGARARIHRRLVAYARDLVEELLAPLRAPLARELPAAGRGVLYQIEQGLGTALAEGAAAQLAELSARDREILDALGVALGERVLYVPALLEPAVIARRAALCRAHFDGAARLQCPRPGAVSLAAPRGGEPRALLAIGYPVFGTRAIRADVAERVHRTLSSSSGGEEIAPAQVASWLGCPVREVQRVTLALAPPSPAPPDDEDSAYPGSPGAISHDP